MRIIHVITRRARHASPLQSRLWRELLTSTFASGVFSPRRGQQNSAQGNALGGTETHIFAPCKGSKVVFIALLLQGFLGARHAIARRIDIENNLNSCAPHTTGESGFAPTLDHWWARRVSPLHD